MRAFIAGLRKSKLQLHFERTLEPDLKSSSDCSGTPSRSAGCFVT